MITSFWLRFKPDAGLLHEALLQNQTRDVFRRIEQILQECGHDYCFDVTSDNRTAILIFSPEGDAATAQDIDKLLKAGPPIPGWLFFGRRQKKPLNDALAIIRNMYGVDLQDATFDLTDSQSELVVTMFSPQVEKLTPNGAKGLVATFLDHAIGEDFSMRHVSRMEARAKGVGPLRAAAFVDAILAARG